MLRFRAGACSWVFACSLLACEVPRPAHSYEPAQRVDSDAAPDDEDDVYADASQVPDFDTPPKGPKPTADGSLPPNVEPGADAAVGEPIDEPPDGPPDSPPDEPQDDPILGEYWMRSDAHARSTTRQLAVTIETDTDTFLYSLVRVGYRDQQLKLFDWQCAVHIDQRCSKGCMSVSTSLLDPAKSAKAYAAAQRDLTVAEDGSWSVSRAPYAVGWRGDFASSPNAALPTSDSDPLVYDPDGGGGKGIDVKSTVRTNAGLTSTCDMRVVQKMDVSFEGKLVDGVLASGSFKDLGSQQNELATTCGNAETTAAESAPATVRFVRAPKPIDSSGATWSCPTLAEFESAFR